MAGLFRVVPSWAWFVVGCVLGGAPQFAFADTYQGPWGITASTTFHLGQHGNTNTAGPFATADAACQALGYPGTHGSLVLDQASLQRTACRNAVGASLGTYAYSEQRRGCPAGGTLNNATGMCENAPACVAPNVRDAATGQCVPPPDPCTANAGKWHSSGYGWRESKPWGPEAMSGTGEVPSTLCADNCAVTVTFDDVIRFPSKNTWSGVGYSQATGQSCQSTNPVPPAPSTGPTDPKTSPEYDCAKSGQGWGTVNGTVVCTGGTTDKETTKTDTSKTTNPDNTTSETQTTTQCQGTTCTETKTTTNCDANGENCTTSTTTTEKTGTGEGGEGEGDEPESKWGGTCGAEPACSGDAIQCAQTKAVWEMNCRYRPSDNSTTAEKIVAGQDPKAAQMPWAEGNVEQKNVGTMLDSTEHFSASCVPDLSFSVAGKAVVVPLSNACNWLGWIGNIMLAGAMLAGLAIAFGRPQ